MTFHSVTKIYLLTRWHMTTTQKTCFKCGISKPISEFYAHKDMADGHLGKCICCTKIDVTTYRARNIEMIRAYDRERAHMPHRIEKNKLITKQWKASNPERRAAQTLLGNAIRAGRIRKHPCLLCGRPAEAHHPDYSAPLDVVWLCSAHHKQAHALKKQLDASLQSSF